MISWFIGRRSVTEPCRLGIIFSPFYPDLYLESRGQPIGSMGQPLVCHWKATLIPPSSPVCHVPRGKWVVSWVYSRRAYGHIWATRRFENKAKSYFSHLKFFGRSGLRFIYCNISRQWATIILVMAISDCSMYLVTNVANSIIKHQCNEELIIENEDSSLFLQAAS